jgi:hypothetical protein
MPQAIEQFSRQRSPVRRFSAFAALAVSLVLVTAAQRDIQRRPAEQIRGSKPLWRLACLNALGAVGYLRWGRRQAR